MAAGVPAVEHFGIQRDMTDHQVSYIQVFVHVLKELSMLPPCIMVIPLESGSPFHSTSPAVIQSDLPMHAQTRSGILYFMYLF